VLSMYPSSNDHEYFVFGKSNRNPHPRLRPSIYGLPPSSLAQGWTTGRHLSSFVTILCYSDPCSISHFAPVNDDNFGGRL
jgi:hypothetical protein